VIVRWSTKGIQFSQYDKLLPISFEDSKTDDKSLAFPYSVQGDCYVFVYSLILDVTHHPLLFPFFPFSHSRIRFHPIMTQWTCLHDHVSLIRFSSLNLIVFLRSIVLLFSFSLPLALSNSFRQLSSKRAAR